jgi:hypothetical protein
MAGGLFEEAEQLAERKLIPAEGGAQRAERLSDELDVLYLARPLDLGIIYPRRLQHVLSSRIDDVGLQAIGTKRIEDDLVDVFIQEAVADDHELGAGLIEPRVSTAAEQGRDLALLEHLSWSPIRCTLRCGDRSETAR